MTGIYLSQFWRLKAPGGRSSASGCVLTWWRAEHKLSGESEKVSNSQGTPAS